MRCVSLVTGWRGCLAAAVPLTCISLHIAEMSSSPSAVVLELESFASQSCPSATSYSICVSLLCLVRWGTSKSSWSLGFQTGAEVASAEHSSSSLILLGCRASIGLGRGKEKECCLRLSCMPQFKKKIPELSLDLASVTYSEEVLK